MFRKFTFLDVTNYYINQIIYAQRWRQICAGGDTTQNFIYEFLSSPVLQWRRQNFGSGGHSVKM